MADRNEPEKLLSVEDVAALLGIHEKTVYDMVRAGDIRGFKVGRIWKFRPSDVRAWQEAKATGEPAEEGVA